MTNYNERLDELLLTTLREMSRELEAYGYLDSKNYLPEKREAITSLMKELVAEAKPAKKDQLAQSTLDDESRCRFYRYGGYNFALDQFERNLLKELEEV